MERRIKQIERTDRIVGEWVGESTDNSNSDIRGIHSPEGLHHGTHT
jgi:hypothetical protein